MVNKHFLGEKPFALETKHLKKVTQKASTPGNILGQQNEMYMYPIIG